MAFLRDGVRLQSTKTMDHAHCLQDLRIREEILLRDGTRVSPVSSLSWGPGLCLWVSDGLAGG